VISVWFVGLFGCLLGHSLVLLGIWGTSSCVAVLTDEQLLKVSWWLLRTWWCGVPNQSLQYIMNVTIGHWCKNACSCRATMSYHVNVTLHWLLWRSIHYKYVIVLLQFTLSEAYLSPGPNQEQRSKTTIQYFVVTLQVSSAWGSALELWTLTVSGWLILL